MKGKSDKTSDHKTTFTLFDSTSTDLNKKFCLVESEIVKSSVAVMIKGKYATHTVRRPDELNDFLNNLESNQAVSIGVCNKGPTGEVKSKKSKQKGAVCRTKDNFEFSNCFIFDLDDSELGIEDIIPVLCEIDPNLENAEILVRVSSSYGVHKTGEQPNLDGCGYHVWVLGVKEPKDIARYGKAFAKRCWLAGQGYIKVSASGAMLVRQLIDAAVFSPERLVFEARPTLGDGIEQLERLHRIRRGNCDV